VRTDDAKEEFVLERDVRGSQVHVHNRSTHECVGCIEVGLFELLRALILAEAGAGKAGRE
jgi:hypothetical protein